MAHTSSSMSINPNQKDLIGQVFEAYVMEHHSGDILNIVTDACEDTHHPIVINAMTLFEANMEVSEMLFAFNHRCIAYNSCSPQMFYHMLIMCRLPLYLHLCKLDRFSQIKRKISITDRT